MYSTRISKTVLAITALSLSAPALAHDPEGQHQPGAFAQAEQTVQDAYIVGRLNSAYALSEHLSAFDINVDANRGDVILKGHVSDAIKRDLAVEIAEGVPEVKSVKDRLRIAPQKEAGKASTEFERNAFVQSVEDASVTAKVKTRLLVNENVRAMDINVDTEDQVVTLSGRVGSDAERDLVEQIANNTDGVAAVNNRLEVVQS